ncbi:D-serine ammonia-lyase [Lentibacillus sediminis]|uniref:D-serine ammonia-lyase n=1 Tax=Lentibacillus sediminis TaxID=1940529 RepID=UPI000C1C34A6|nr:D-serine ammonia-lyase [Lentibacillus sediminis]
MVFSDSKMETWKEKFPLFNKIINLHPVIWQNPNLITAKDFDQLPLTKENMEEADRLWDRFAPFLAKAFPETSATNGIIESELRKLTNMKQLMDDAGHETLGELYLKCDNDLPIAGSIKARGGFFEVLHHAETLAIKEGLVQKGDDYEVFASDKFKSFFQQFSIGVGSTGNLGLSIGIMGAKLGFNVSVYMSADAKQWKKDLLRKKGATVHEFTGDFGVAIDEGRKQTIADPKGYFVDDEDSKLLYLGYSVAALRLKKQLEEKNISVDAERPLFVYLPCGVGGSPGGITFGLKQLFGDHVHCFFVEPVNSPSVLLGLMTGEMDQLSVQDVGVDNVTEADGLAVGRPSSFATPISDKLVSGIYTIEDHTLFELLTMLADSENIFLEPSATAGLVGPGRILQTDYVQKHNLKAENITHIAWATGGALVPEGDMELFYGRGKEFLESWKK